MNREAWLNAVAERMAPRFADLGYPLPAFRVSVGFTSGGARSNANAEVWSSKCSADGKFEILIRPDVADAYMAASLLAHELSHAAVGLNEGHKGKFIQVMIGLGLSKPFTSTVPTPAFNDWVEPFVMELGNFPHGSLNFLPSVDVPAIGRRKPPTKAVEGLRVGMPQEEVREIMTSAKPKEGTRLKKAFCETCGYTVRVTQKWIEVGPPHCPLHGAMAVQDAGSEPATEKGE